jgi:aryl-alcohol dehydrogenase-like predicted oxidoreductase
MSFGGTGRFEAVGTVDVGEARRITDVCLDAGVNLIDTADLYSYGAAEEMVGTVIKGRRDRVLISTKVAFATGLGPNDGGLSRHHVIAACEASLRRLQVDHIDIYHAHMWDGHTPLSETMEALDTLVRQGKVRYLGCSNHSAWHFMKALAVSDGLGLERYVSHQIYYSVVAREAEYELIPAALDQGVGLLIWSPLAGGFLTGNYKRDGTRPAEGRGRTRWTDGLVRDPEQAFDIIDVLNNVANDHGTSIAQAALSYVLDAPGVTSVIVGARSAEQVADSLRVANWQLEPAERERLDAASAMDLLYPYSHQAAENADRLSPADLSLLQRHLGQPLAQR